MDNEEFVFELRLLASRAEGVIQAAPGVRELPPALTAGITDAALRLSDLLCLLAREVEPLAPNHVPNGPSAET